jgi:uncharacterized membrane protein YfcA
VSVAYDIELAGTIAIAAVLAGATGFGFNLFATPVLALFMPVRRAVVISLLVGIVVTAVISGMNARDVRPSVLWPLAVGAVVGTVGGTVVFHASGADMLQVVVGALSVASIPVFLLHRRSPSAPHGARRMAPGVGVISGVMTAISGMGGPPVVGYLLTTGGTSRGIRATIAAYSTVAAAVSVGLLAATGAVSPRPIYEGLAAVPVALGGVALGSAAIRARPQHYLPTAIAAGIGLACLGLVLAIRGIYGNSS